MKSLLDAPIPKQRTPKPRPQKPVSRPHQFWRILLPQPRCAIFFEGEWKSAKFYDYCVIMVENSAQDVQVTFYVTDAHEMNWLPEFLDSQFFSRDESEKLFQLMNARHDVRGQNVGRFRVDFHHWQPRHAQLLVFSFTPLRDAR